MKTMDAIIYSLPIDCINKVYLVGERCDYYKLYLEQKDKCIIRIDLKSTIEDNFISHKVVNQVSMGKVTQKIGTYKALQLLNTCTWEKGIKPDPKILNIVLQLLKIKNFKLLKKEIENNLPFLFWIRKQVERDDLIGDLAYDILSDREIGIFKTYKELESRISFKMNGHWEINSFKDSKKVSGGVSPLLCLKLAKMEFDISKKKEQLKNFRIPNNFGYIYFLMPETGDQLVKIGRARIIKQRIAHLQTSLPYDLKLIGFIQTSDCTKLEKDLHEEYKGKNKKREWFNLDIHEVKSIINNHNGEIVT